ncbi:hypothetical protein ACFFQF_21455 [Haladaptatus pallidirubidus]
MQDLNLPRRPQKRAQAEQFGFRVEAPGMVDVTNECYDNPR